MRIVLVLFGIGFAALVARASVTGDFGASGAWLLGDPWGLVTLVDLYLGLFLCGVVICLFERRAVPAFLWCLPLPFLGNLWTVVWFVFRWPALRRAFGRFREGEHGLDGG